MDASRWSPAVRGIGRGIVEARAQGAAVAFYRERSDSAREVVAGVTGAGGTAVRRRDAADRSSLDGFIAGALPARAIDILVNNACHP